MDQMNRYLRMELDRFKLAKPDVKYQVVKIVADAGALDWLLEVCQDDHDPLIREYADIAREHWDV